MRWFTDAHWFGKTLGTVVGLAFLFSCFGLSGPILADVQLVEWICGPSPTPTFFVVTLLIETPQFFLFVYGATISGQLFTNTTSSKTKFSLRTLLQLSCVFSIFTFVYQHEWNTFKTRTNSEMHGFIDYISPVWLIEGPLMTNVVLCVGLFCGSFGLIDLVWDQIERKTKQLRIARSKIR